MVSQPIRLIFCDFLAAIAALYVAMSVCRSVRPCQRVSRSMKCLKDALKHNVTVFYALCITVSVYTTLCIEDTMFFMQYANETETTSCRKAEMK